jgi:hypothetical protein
MFTARFALRKVAARIAREVVFSLKVHEDDLESCTDALRGANLIALSAISALNRYAALGLDDAIDNVEARLPLPTVP